jgi:short-chain fatty acids transporter
VAGIGISQAGPIYGATPNGLRALVSEAVKPLIPEVIPLGESVLLPANLINCILLGVIVLFVCLAIRPKKDENIIVADDALIAEIEAQNKIGTEKPKISSPAEWIDNSLILSLVVGIAGLIWIIKFVATVGLGNISINNFNFILLFLGLLLCGSPNQFIKGVQSAVNATWGVIIQFPFYAGIFGIIAYTGLATVIVNFFMRFATTENFPWICYIYSSILNMAVPSGGSKFIIEAPYILEVATRLNIPIGKILLSYTAGDQTTNIIQPFWALPYLTMFHIDFKKILPFTVLACVAAYVVFSIFFIFVY